MEPVAQEVEEEEVCARAMKLTMKRNMKSIISPPKYRVRRPKRTMRTQESDVSTIPIAYCMRERSKAPSVVKPAC
jgi:hypothetical protein